MTVYSKFLGKILNDFHEILYSSISHIQATESKDNVHEGSKSALSQKLIKVGYNVCVTENDIFESLGPVVQSIVSLTSSLRGQLVKCFRTLSPNTLKFFVEKMREAFALSNFYNKKYWQI